MGQIMKEISKMTNIMIMEWWNLTMAIFMMGNGRKVEWMVRVFLKNRMVKF